MQHLLFFRVNGITGALPFQKAVCMIRMVTMIPPEDTSQSLWTINFHGSLIPVYSVRKILGLPEEPPKPDDNLIIAKSHHGDVALWVKDINLFNQGETAMRSENVTGVDLAGVPGIVNGNDGYFIIEDLELFLGLQQDNSGNLGSRPDSVPYRRERIQNPVQTLSPDMPLLDKRAQELAILSREREASDTIQVLQFSLLYRQYAIEMRYIREVILTREITPVPGTPGFVAGICPIRGEIISLVDLRELLNIEGSGLTDFNQVIVISGNTITFGILADQIIGVRNISPDQITSCDHSLDPCRFLKSITDESFLLVDAAILLSDPAMIIDDTEDDTDRDFHVSDNL